MADDVTPDVSVVLPIHDERGHLGLEIDRIRTSLDASPHTWELIVVDDGSTDGSSELLDAIDGIRLFRFDRNRGCGAARRLGTSEARGDIVAWTDVDMSYPNERLPELVDRLGHDDQVVGARRGEHGRLRWVRASVKWLIRSFASWTMATRIDDLNSGMRVFRREVAEPFLPLLPPGFSCVSTLTMTFLAHGHSVVYEPVEYRPRAGQGKFRWWADTRRYLQQVVRLSLRYAPLRTAIPAVVATTAGGLVLLAIGDTAAWFGGMLLAASVVGGGAAGLAQRRLRPPVRPPGARGTSPSGPG